MVAAVFTNTTIIELMREVVQDMGGDEWEFVPEAVYKRMVFKRLQKESTYIFRKIYTGLWNYSDGPIYLYGMTFTGQDDATYHLYSDGSIELTEGTDVSDTLTVSGCKVDFGMVVSDFLFFLATNHADEIATSAQGVGKSPANVRKELMDMAAMWCGARGGSN